METLSTYLDALAQQAHLEGGWGYAPDRAAQVEPTCMGLLALSLQADRYGPILERSLKFLERCAGADGSYRLPNGRDEAIWPTSLVLFTRKALTPDSSPPAKDAAAALEKSVAFLLSVPCKTPDNPEAGELLDIDMKLTGWPWAEQNFSWVEPTSWACLALRALGQGKQPRVQQGLDLLLDRAMDEGGINYGNRRILGKMTEPIPGPTALMLLALQPGADVDESKSNHPRIAAAVQYLLKQIDCDDVEHLGWIKLALDAHRGQPGVEEALGRFDAALATAFRHRQETPWLKQAPLRLALLCLALGTGERNFFKVQGARAAANVTPAAGRRKPSLGQRFGAWFRGLAIKAAGQLRQLPANSAVHIARAADYNDNLADILHKQYEHFRPAVPLAGKRVVLKPNLVEYHRDKVINTNPQVVGAVIELCKREGAADITVAEGPGHWRNVEYLVAASGLGDVLQKHGVPFVDLNHDEPVKTPNLGRLTGLEYLFLSRTIAGAEVVISLPKLKTHHWAGATLSLKNLFGTLPGICYGWPKNELHWRGIDNSIVDIALTRTPDLAIVDGIVGMEGDGPLNGVAKPFGALIMGHDLIAVDATCCRLMMLNPEKLGYLMLGAMKKLGRYKEEEIQQLGEKIADLAQPFETVPHLDQIRLKRPA
ncbi:MAG: DUF362 domain-containing protein [Gemmataceae bacterium]|nr:DUF362 domain-containing protein [Gemmataceae bacterium]MCI0743468.1 DUF362 domain-containing protein [Gemmataceae bacterium]